MSNYEATVIETGNSYALRVPKAYMEKNHLKKGQKVRLPSPMPLMSKTNHDQLKNDLAELRKLGTYKTIKDPIKWQREQRSRSNQAGREY